MTTSKNEDQWTLVIEPKPRLLDLHLREVAHYRDLVWLFVKRDFTTVYKQTFLGPLWFVIQPLITTVMYAFVFGRLAKISTDGLPQILFYFSGTMLWTYFENCFRSSADTFTTNASLFGKIYFPRLTAPLSRTFSNMITLGIQFAALLCIFGYYLVTGAQLNPSWGILAFPLIVLWIAALGNGVGMIVSSLTTRYRYLRNLIGFGFSLWMYATPVVYPLSQVPQNLRWAFFVNPMSAPVELFRIAFYGVGHVGYDLAASSVAITIVLLAAGLILFNRNERTFIDVI